MTSHTDPAGGWNARLELEIVRDGERSLLGKRRHIGPLRIQRAFHPEGSVAHVYLLHPPGGLVGGDATEVRIDVRDGASALVTTPAAQKLYRSIALPSRQAVALHVGPEASLEWLPGEAIVFDGARARQHTRVELSRGSRFIGWEMGSFGRPASGIRFTRGEIALGFELHRGGEPLVVDRQLVSGGSPELEAPWGYADMPAWGSLYAVSPETPNPSELVTLLRDRLVASAPDERVGITGVDGVVIVRGGARSLARIRDVLVAAWHVLRPVVVGRAPVPPRIWAT